MNYAQAQKNLQVARDRLKKAQELWKLIRDPEFNGMGLEESQRKDAQDYASRLLDACKLKYADVTLQLEEQEPKVTPR